MKTLILLCLISLAVAAPIFQQDEGMEKQLTVESILNSRRSPRDLHSPKVVRRKKSKREMMWDNQSPWTF